MTQVLITVDTELSALLHQRGATPEANLAASVTGDYGIGWQMECLARHGLKAVYFVDPMPALVYGPAIVARMVAPILAQGHDVQLHIHTEWLAWAMQSPVGNRRGKNIADFSLADQLVLLDWARATLVAAGAPCPTVFRAGNFGANDDTLRALAALGFAWDASFNPALRDGRCRIGLGAGQVDPVVRLGVAELPVAAIHDGPAGLRPAQVCALSSAEMRAALHHAARTGRPALAIVTHSFEMLSRDRLQPNRAVMARFESLCRTIAAHPRLDSAEFADLAMPPAADPHARAERLPPHALRRLSRIAGQALATWVYDRQIFPG